MTTTDAPLHLNLNGYTTLPPGKIAAITTRLEMTSPAPPLPERAGHGLRLDRVRQPDLHEYRALYRRIGEPWLWFSRLKLSDDALAGVLTDENVHVHLLRREADGAAGEALGLMELDFRVPGEVELAFLGVVPELVGSGAGRVMMNRALALAWAPNPRRVHLHTCTLDRQEAMAFYMRAGFRPYERAIEVVDDPRLNGTLSPLAAPHAPLIAPR